MKIRQIRSALLAPLAVAFLGAPLLAEVDKQDLEKKAPDEAKGKIDQSGETLHDNLVQQGQANLKRIAELMEKIQNDLAEKNTGTGTQQKQREVVNEIDKLIDDLLKASQGGSSGQPQPNQQPQQGSKQQKDQKQASQQRQNERMQEMKPGEQQKQQQEQQQQQQEDREQYGPTKNDRVEEGKNPPARPRKLGDVLRDSGQWGNLPKKLQEELLHSADKEFPTEYKEIISKYFKRLATFESTRQGKADESGE